MTRWRGIGFVFDEMSLLFCKMLHHFPTHFITILVNFVASLQKHLHCLLLNEQFYVIYKHVDVSILTSSCPPYLSLDGIASSCRVVYFYQKLFWYLLYSYTYYIHCCFGRFGGQGPLGGSEMFDDMGYGGYGGYEHDGGMEE